MISMKQVREQAIENAYKPPISIFCDFFSTLVYRTKSYERFREEYDKIVYDLDIVLYKYKHSKQFFNDFVLAIKRLNRDQAKKKVDLISEQNAELKYQIKVLRKELTELKNNRYLEKKRLALLEEKILFD